MHKRLPWFYISNSRIPSEKAHGAQIVKTCEALIENGIKLTLVLPNRQNQIEDKTEDYYSLRVKLPVKFLSTIDLLLFAKKRGLTFLDPVLFIIESLFFYINVYFFTRNNPGSIVFTRDYYSPVFCFRRERVLWEVHEIVKTKIGRLIMIASARWVRGIVCPNLAVMDFFLKNNIPKRKLHYFPNGVDLEMFKKAPDKNFARRSLGIDTKDKIAMYVGNMALSKGVNTFIESAKFLPDNIKVYLYGGPFAQRELANKFTGELGLSNKVKICADFPYRMLPRYLAAADVLVLPNSAKDIYASAQTSPLKLFAYLASGKPIAASAVESLVRVYSGERIKYFEPDNPEQCASAILYWLGKPQMRFYDSIQKYSLKKRMNDIICNLGYDAGC